MKVNQLKSGVILSYLSLFIGNLISIVYTPIMLRLLGQSEYGLYSLAGTVVGYLGLLSFGFGSAYIRFFSRDKVVGDDKGIAKLNGMFITVFSMIGILALFCGAVLVANTVHIFAAGLTAGEIAKAKILMAILTVNIAISFPFSVFDSYVTANEAYLFQKVLSMIRTVINPFIMLPVLLLGFQSVGMVVATTVINILAGLVNIGYCKKKLHMKISFGSFDFRLLKEIAIFSSFIFINIVVDQINWHVDKFLLGMFQSTAAVAIYGIASQLNSYYLEFSLSISSVFIPRVNQLVAKGDHNAELTDLFTRVGRVQFIVLSLIFTGLIFFGKAFIMLWAGDNYATSYVIALILILPVTIPSIQNLGIEIQRAKNMHKFRSLVYFAIALGNVLLSIPLCKRYGGVGCAIGTAISLLIGNGIVMNIYYHKKIGLNMLYFWKQILKMCPAFVLPVALGILFMRFAPLHQVLAFLACGAVYVLVFGVNMWFFGMNDYERELFVKPVRRILKACKILK